MATRLGTHQVIMLAISKNGPNTFLERLFIYDDPCKWYKLSEYIRLERKICIVS